jgi:hypothetical protein
MYASERSRVATITPKKADSFEHTEEFIANFESGERKGDFRIKKVVQGAIEDKVNAGAAMDDGRPEMLWKYIT